MKSLPLMEHVHGTDYYNIIDIRSPSEYQQGHIPGALNIPLFDDQQRHNLGLTYKHQGKTEAVALGLQYVAHQIEGLSDALTKTLVNAGNPKKALIYCWRGGMRSTSLCLFMRASGFNDTMTIKGGYKAYRRAALAEIDRLAQKAFLVLHGKTGSGKTSFLRQLPDSIPHIDFEYLAKHRGSAFGGLNIDEPSPSQQQFENLLAQQAYLLRTQPCIVVEIENFLGPVRLPSCLRKKIYDSPMICLRREQSQRIKTILNEYLPPKGKAIDSHYEKAFYHGLQQLQQRLSHEQRHELEQDWKEQRFEHLVDKLLSWHYDPLYKKSLKKYGPQIIAEFDFDQDQKDLYDFIERYVKQPYS